MKQKIRINTTLYNEDGECSEIFIDNNFDGDFKKAFNGARTRFEEGINYSLEAIKHFEECEKNKSNIKK